MHTGHTYPGDNDRAFFKQLKTLFPRLAFIVRAKAADFIQAINERCAIQACFPHSVKTGPHCPVDGGCICEIARVLQEKLDVFLTGHVRFEPIGFDGSFDPALDFWFSCW